MRTGIVAFLIGNFCLLYWPVHDFFSPQLFIFSLLALSFCSTLILYKAKSIFAGLSTNNHKIHLKKLISFVFFFSMGGLYTQLYIDQFYPELDFGQDEGKTIEVRGTIASIPKKTTEKQTFDFIISSAKLPSEDFKLAIPQQWNTNFSGKVRLSWYYHYLNLKNGQQWQMKVRLKKPNGFLNGGFDYEKWLFHNRILATGYVREGKRIEQAQLSSFGSKVIGLRQELSTKLDIVLKDYPYRGLVKALTIGVRHDISPEQWQVFLRTGTNHLIAISGLHIGLISTFVWLLVYHVWRFIERLNIIYPATYVASVLALIAAVGYAALAGFAIPTQRALIMLCVVFMAILFKREFYSSYVFLLALLAVVLFDPLSALSPGFWLSFGAVAVILFIVSNRLAMATGVNNKLYQFGWLQVAIFIGLMPLLMLLFLQFSLLSPIANLFAVPLMSIVIVPLTMLATISLLIFESAGLVLFNLLEWPVEFFFWSLNYLKSWPKSLIHLPEPSLLVAFLASIGALWLLMPKGWPARWLGILLVLPLFFNEPKKIPYGELQLTMLDVGQGLSMVLRTQNHVLVYDTGDKYNETFNLADKVILPFLRRHGIHTIDKLLISHSDRDHAGSYFELLEQVGVNEVLAGEPHKLSVKLSSNNNKSLISLNQENPTVLQCIVGQKWYWDGVEFEVLSPDQTLGNLKNNNRSCVLLISTLTKKRILLTGDIEKKIEKQLLKKNPKLEVDVLQVPHHGSKTSSSSAFLNQLQPKMALFSYGYRNRFHHPSLDVVNRYKESGGKMLTTRNGAIEIQSNMTNNSISVKEYRVIHQKIWHYPVISL